MTPIRERWHTLHKTIHNDAVQIVAVTKYATPAQMCEAYHAGARIFGESKIQDALHKMETLPTEIATGVDWHFIGHLQTNKVNKTLGKFSLIHTIDSVRLAEVVSQKNAATDRCQPVLLQINISGEETKHGFSVAEIQVLFPHLQKFSGLEIRGLMTMAPYTKDVSVIRQTFSGLKVLRDTLSACSGSDLPELSMGMSQDFLHALECGATIIRTGSYLFGSN